MLFESVAMQKIPQNEKAIDNLFKVINGFFIIHIIRQRSPYLMQLMGMSTSCV